MRRIAILLVAWSLLVGCASRPAPDAPAWDGNVTSLAVAAVDRDGRPIYGASVEIDGEDAGTTPTRRWVPHGTHRIVVRQADLSGEVSRKLDGTAELLTVQLLKLPEEPSTPENRPTLGRGMDPAEIDARIKTYLGPIQHCYERALGTGRPLGGKLVVSFRIRPDGTVSYAYTKSARELLAPDVLSCVEKAFLKMTFSADPERDVITVNYPLMFKTI